MKAVMVGLIAVLALAACGEADPTESDEFHQVSEQLSTAEQERDDATATAEEVKERNSELTDEVEGLSTEVDGLAADVDEIAEQRDRIEGERDKARADLKQARRERNRAQAEVRRLREQYDPEIRATLQAEVDTAVAGACQAAIDDIDAPIGDLVTHDKRWKPIVSEQDLVKLVEDCAAPERAKTREQREADRLANCQPVAPDQLEKNPAAHEGACVVMYAHIVQFDANTGPCSFHANIAPPTRSSGTTTTSDLRSATARTS